MRARGQRVARRVRAAAVKLQGPPWRSRVSKIRCCSPAASPHHGRVARDDTFAGGRARTVLDAIFYSHADGSEIEGDAGLSVSTAIGAHSDIRMQSLGPLSSGCPTVRPVGGTCFCHEVNESLPCSGDHVTSPIN